jgi:hypothetical protein
VVSVKPDTSWCFDVIEEFEWHFAQEYVAQVDG